MADELVEVFQKVAPELVRTIEERYAILQQISYAQPVGRRVLAGLVPYSERVIRSHVEIMKACGLLNFTSQGMELTPEGTALFPKLAVTMNRFAKIADLAERIRKAFSIESVHIASGYNATDADVHRLGRLSASILAKRLKAHSVYAVSGGTTMAAMAQAFTPKNCFGVFIPARGGVGEHIDRQANSIASTLAEKTKSANKMLHIPDGLSPDTLDLLVRTEPQIREIRDLSKEVDLLMFGIGDALQMADQRRIGEDLKDVLVNYGAVGEALGCYCDELGNVVYETRNIGIGLTDIQHISTVIMVAGGADKAKAIIGVMRACRRGILVIDEGAAHEIESLLGL